MNCVLIVVEQRLAGGHVSAWAPDGAPLACVANRPLIAHIVGSLRQAGIEHVVVVADHASASRLRQVLARDGGGAADVDWVELDAPVDETEAIGAAAGVLAGESFVLHRPDGLVMGDPAALRDALAAGAWRRKEAIHLVETDPGCLRAEDLDGWWQYGGSAQDLLDANREILDRRAIAPPQGHWPETRLEGRVDVHPTARLRGAVVRGPAVIGAGATVVDAYVGPYTAIGEDATVENAEVEGSMLLDRASLCNVGVRIEASILGRGATVSRDFRLPRAMRLLVGAGAQVTLG
jgi:glucose-1-phosphate thymidylyltransferase